MAGAIVNVTYGHNGSGKLYSYLDPKGTRRAGDEVVVAVTKKLKSGAAKTYKTLGVIQSTHGSQTASAENTQDFLADKGIGLKTVTGGSQRQLPGYYPGWKKDSDERYRQKVELNKALGELRMLPGMEEKSFAEIRKLAGG